MSLGHRVRVPSRHRQFVFGDDPRRIDVAEDAAVRPFAITRSHTAKIGRIAVALHRVARIAERLEVAQIVRTARTAWNDMIDLKSAIFGARAAQLASKHGALQNLIAQGA